MLMIKGWVDADDKVAHLIEIPDDGGHFSSMMIMMMVKMVYLIWIPDDDLVVRLSRCVDQLQCDAGKVDCQPIREHLLKR